MARLNTALKFLILNVNYAFVVLALCLVGLALYVLIANWGQLDPGFFSGIGAIMLLVGFILGINSISGNFGVTHQRIKYGLWSGRKVLLMYQGVLLAILAGTIYCIFIALFGVNSLKATSTLIEQGEIPPYTPTERFLANKFNSFFFGAAYKSCKDPKYSFFWPFVNAQCDFTINSQACQKCEDYTPTSCIAQSSQCSTKGQGNNDPYNAGCPYKYCRLQILSFLVSNISYVSYSAIAIVAFAFIIMSSTCMLICYTEKDTLDRQVFKSGTMANNTATNPNSRPPDGSSRVAPINQPSPKQALEQPTVHYASYSNGHAATSSSSPQHISPHTSGHTATSPHMSPHTSGHGVSSSHMSPHSSGHGHATSSPHTDLHTHPSASSSQQSNLNRNMNHRTEYDDHHV